MQIFKHIYAKQFYDITLRELFLFPVKRGKKQGKMLEFEMEYDNIKNISVTDKCPRKNGDLFHFAIRKQAAFFLISIN